MAAAVAVAEGCRDGLGTRAPLAVGQTLRSRQGRQAAPTHVPSCIPVLCGACQEVVLLLFSFLFCLFLHTSYSQILQFLMIGEAWALGSDPDLNFKDCWEILESTFLTYITYCFLYFLFTKKSSCKLFIFIPLF